MESNDVSPPRTTSCSPDIPASSFELEGIDPSVQRRWSDTDAQSHHLLALGVTTTTVPRIGQPLNHHLLPPLSPIPSSPPVVDPQRAAQSTSSYFSETPESLVPDDTPTPTSATATAAFPSTSAQESKQAGTSQSESEKTFHALKELVDSEKAYHERLVILVHIYYRLLHFTQLFSEEQISQITRNAHELLALHNQLGKELSPVLDELSRPGISADSSRIAKCARRAVGIYLGSVALFDAYIEFCSTHTESLETLKRVERTPEWEALERQASLSAALLKDQDQLDPATALSAPDLISAPTTTGTPSASAWPPPEKTKFRFVDYAIAPVQRICRYPMLFDQVAKSVGGVDQETFEKVKAASRAFKDIAERVDSAKRAREREVCAAIIRTRLHVGLPTSEAFHRMLGSTVLVGALFFLKHVPSPDPATSQARIKYYCCVLYPTHLVMLKVRKRTKYEPREWLPLRSLQLQVLERGESTLPHAFKLTCEHIDYDLGATCKAERTRWVQAITDAQREAVSRWKNSATSTRNAQDETNFSSAVMRKSTADEEAGMPFASLPARTRAPHNRSNSSPPGGASDDWLKSPATTSSSSVDTLVASYHNLGPMVSTSRQKLSATGAFLLGRTDASYRSEVDIRLADIFSDELLGIRARAARELASLTLKSVPQAHGRSTTNLARFSRDWRRSSYTDTPATSALLATAMESPDLRDETSIRDSEGATVRRAATLSSIRPKRLSIDTSVPPVSVQAWRAKVARKTGSSTSLKTSGRKDSSSAVDVERNNSVSSNTSSSEAGTGSTSSVTHGILVADTPPSSVPPSPALETVDLLSPDSAATVPQSSFRRGPRDPKAESTANGNAVSRSWRSRPAFGSYFSKRIQSSPTLSNLFARASLDEKVSSEFDSTSARAAGLTSASTPYLDDSPSYTSTPTSIVSSPAVSAPSSPEMGYVSLPAGGRDGCFATATSSHLLTSTPSLVTDETTSTLRKRSSSSTTTSSSKSGRPSRFAFHSQYKLTPMS